MSKKDIPARLELVFGYIIAFKTESGGDSPSHREICDQFGYISTSMAHRDLLDLEQMGLIVRSNGRRRKGIRVIGGQWSYTRPENGSPDMDSRRDSE